NLVPVPVDQLHQTGGLEGRLHELIPAVVELGLALQNLDPQSDRACVQSGDQEEGAVERGTQETVLLPFEERIHLARVGDLPAEDVGLPIVNVELSVEHHHPCTSTGCPRVRSTFRSAGADDECVREEPE